MKNKITKEQLLRVFTITCVLTLISSSSVFAATDTTAIDTVIQWIADWSKKIGLIVAFFGGIQTAMAFKNDDADAKVRGLKTLASGFMVAGVSQSLSLFGL